MTKKLFFMMVKNHNPLCMAFTTFLVLNARGR